ncbi:MAG: hypothetical protein KGN78_13170 [Actinomycetales bacterium]|nr:hypothetical protein [Actinomycetales bacterium]
MRRSIIRVAVPIAALFVLGACAGDTSNRQAEGTSVPVASAASADSVAAAPVTCPERSESGDDFMLRKVKIVNETNATFRLSVPADQWSCDDFSGADNPSRLNGLQIAPNPRSPLIVPVRARWLAPNLPVTVLKNNPGSDLPWTPVARTEWGAGGFYGYAPAQPGTSRLGSYPLQDANGSTIGLLIFSAYNHKGELEEDTFNAIRLWPADYQQLDNAGAQDDVTPQSVR